VGGFPDDGVMMRDLAGESPIDTDNHGNDNDNDSDNDNDEYNEINVSSANSFHASINDSPTRAEFDATDEQVMILEDDDGSDEFVGDTR
jgi:hypothetical protein